MRKHFIALLVFAGLVVLCGQAAPYRYGEFPVVAVPNLDNQCQANAATVHYWRFADSPTGSTPGPAPTQLADSISTQTCATGAPSPVPLNYSTPAASPWPYVGDVGMVPDGTTSAELTNTVLGAQGQWFTIAQAGLFSTLCNGNAGGSCTSDFSIECVVDNHGLSGTQFFFSADGTATGLAFGFNGTTGPVVQLNATSLTNFSESSSMVPTVFAYTFAHATGLSSVYENGVEVEATTSPVPQASPNSITYFGSHTGSAGGWDGRIEKCRLDNVADSPQLIRADFLSSGIP